MLIEHCYKRQFVKTGLKSSNNVFAHILQKEKIAEKNHRVNGSSENEQWYVLEDTCL